MAKRLLVVDDDPDILQFLKDRLESMGYVVQTAQNGHEALAILPEFAPDGLLLDIEMPTMDGISLLREVKQRLGQVPIIMMTSASHTDRLVQALVESASDYLFKPIDRGQLIEKCARYFP